VLEAPVIVVVARAAIDRALELKGPKDRLIRPGMQPVETTHLTAVWQRRGLPHVTGADPVKQEGQGLMTESQHPTPNTGLDLMGGQNQIPGDHPPPHSRPDHVPFVD
jgi:hypothetical protein